MVGEWVAAKPSDEQRGKAAGTLDELTFLMSGFIPHSLILNFKFAFLFCAQPKKPKSNLIFFCFFFFPLPWGEDETMLNWVETSLRLMLKQPADTLTIHCLLPTNGSLLACHTSAPGGLNCGWIVGCACYAVSGRQLYKAKKEGRQSKEGASTTGDIANNLLKLCFSTSQKSKTPAHAPISHFF